MNKPLTRQHRLLAAIGHASRFRLFLLLAEQERCVTELALEVGLSQSCTTRHVQALAAAGVVAGKRDGKRVRVRLRLERPEVAGLLAWARLGALDAVAPMHAGDGAVAPAERDRRAGRDAGAGTKAKPSRRGSSLPRANGRAAAATAGAGVARPETGFSVTSRPDNSPERDRLQRPVRQDLEDFLL